ncbi:type II secretion system protein [Allofournierella sp.]|uniref:type II secretion system protein n=1 Tax=Allofournierella sp. TaxID=1940256 RepID=UPI003AB74B04
MLKKMLKQRSKKGFTLIELIVVLVIMAILAAAAIPTMMGYVNNARKSAYLANCSAAYMAAQANITEQMGKAVTAIDTDEIVTAVQKMVPELAGADKVLVVTSTTSVAGTATKAEQYVITVDTTISNPKAIRVAYHKVAGDTEYVYVNYTGDGSTNVMD